MHDWPKIDVVVTFLTESEGGRKNPAFASSKYRPHVVVESVNERAPGSGVYLGVCFEGDEQPMEPGVSHPVRLALPYHPTVDYGQLESGATFTIREGARVVGFGRVTGGVEDELT